MRILREKAVRSWSKLTRARASSRGVQISSQLCEDVWPFVWCNRIRRVHFVKAKLRRTRAEPRVLNAEFDISVCDTTRTLMFIIRSKDATVKKCVSVAMARKNSDGGPRSRPKGPQTTPRHSPVRSSASPTGAGHYAGCKWTEPPLPSALPPPPQHWMQAPHSRVLPFRQPKLEQHDIENQLKVLLKVQAWPETNRRCHLKRHLISLYINLRRVNNWGLLKLNFKSVGSEWTRQY